MYQANSNYVLRTVADENVLVPLAATGLSAGTLLMLNETGAFLWRQLEQPQTMEALIAASKAQFDDAEENAEQEIQEFIAAMLQIGLVEERG